MIRTKPQLPIGSKLALIQGLLLAVVVGISALAFMTLDRLAGSAERVAQRYAPQLDLISDVQVLMFRISLEARHAMLVETDEEQSAAADRGDHEIQIGNLGDQFECGGGLAGGEGGNRRMRNDFPEFRSIFVPLGENLFRLLALGGLKVLVDDRLQGLGVVRAG